MKNHWITTEELKKWVLNNLISDNEFKDLTDELGESTCYVLDETRSASVLPVLIVYTTPDTSGVRDCICFAIPEFGENIKDILMSFGAEIHKEGLTPIAAFLRTEVWASKTEGIKHTVMPVDDPNKKERVMLAGCTIDGRCNLKVINIDRDENGGIRPVSYNSHYCCGSENNVHNNFIHSFFVGYLKAAVEIDTDYNLN